LRSTIVFCFVVSACGTHPGEPLDVEMVASGQSEFSYDLDMSNSCSTVMVGAIHSQQQLEELMEGHLEGVEIPVFDFEEGFALLSYAPGCPMGGVQITVDGVWLDDGKIYVEETIDYREAHTENVTRPFTLSKVSAEWDGWHVVASSTVEWDD
jgi:hypothetical protein